MADGTYITRVEAKAHLNVDFSDDDTYIDGLIAMAEQLVLVEIQGSADGEGTVSFTSGSTALSGVDTNFMDFTSGDTITIDGDTIKYTSTIATITDKENLDFTCGFSTTESGLGYTVNYGLPLGTGVLPKVLKQAMLLMIAHFYANREPVIIGVGAAKMPYGYDFLVSPYKNWTVC